MPPREFQVLLQPREIELKDCFSYPLLDVMNFLNEVVLDYPDAVSFAPGRPLETLFNVENHVSGIAEFVAEQAETSGKSKERIWKDLGQYNRTNGIINDLIASHLEQDEGIHVGPDAIMVTVGAQEAMAVILASLFEPSKDVLLVSDPTYIGITGLARILGIRVVPVPLKDEGLDPLSVEQIIIQTSRSGCVRALYDVPDFNNPLGTSLSFEHRLKLIEICKKYGVLLIEDNPYGMFNYDGSRLPTLKSLDQDGVVLYIGSFSKTLFPGLRLGYLVANQRVGKSGQILAKELSKVKSLITVNTSTLCQAIAASALRNSGNSMEPIVANKRLQFCRNRDTLLGCLAREFEGLESQVRWNRPGGGFFVTVTLPFPFGTAELRRCAADYGVIVCPMNFFSVVGDRENQIRLSFSYVQEEQIYTGSERLARFVRDRCRHA
jgi:(S)-3,5-dihydroxyphenylglycine transaminase